MKRVSSNRTEILDIDALRYGDLAGTFPEATEVTGFVFAGGSILLLRSNKAWNGH